MPRANPSGQASDAAPARQPAKRAAERITEVARELFYRQGIRAVGVDEIVNRAGVTKPSLYRSYASKDELAAACLRGYDAAFWMDFDQAAADHPHDPRVQILTWMEGLAASATQAGHRGCGLTNAAVEYPLPGHPARLVAEAGKAELRRRLRDLTARMGARHADRLGDGLLLLIEGAYASGQVFGEGGPAGVVALAAEALIDAHLGRRPPARPRKPDGQPKLL